MSIVITQEMLSIIYDIVLIIAICIFLFSAYDCWGTEFSPSFVMIFLACLFFFYLLVNLKVIVFA
jgi:hypothetical protein